MTIAISWTSITASALATPAIDNTSGDGMDEFFSIGRGESVSARPSEKGDLKA